MAEINPDAPALAAGEQRFLRRCFQLARLGAGSVSPNPMVGAVLAYDNRIIGEGWHQRYGEAHAEVQAIRAVARADRNLTPRSTLYCALEPCFHHGKTPPCVDLILEQKIPRVVVSSIDPNPLTGGQSVAKLRAAGVEVIARALEAEGRSLNRAFFTWMTQKRPYIILKWAQSADGYLGRAAERTPISGPLAQRLVHRWRSEVDAILVGAKTARTDNPRLDNRWYSGKSPLRVALDFSGKIPGNAHLLDDSMPTWILGGKRPGQWKNTTFLPLAGAGPDLDWIPFLLEKLHAGNRAILLVEGGAYTLRQFLDNGCWDEIRVLENPVRLGGGIAAPRVPESARLETSGLIGTDRVEIWLLSEAW
ncbi:MAG: bifunctional diaminohydroxyphosphoribosylaminopyrimidine deaminase/5-amino-6-(5-phosphoribosylamino)uracil reductase RibD [Saprospirales bacterium]|jgi:diaminohydroxyphosphoribosylaminopyrimidine deaminase/5-amino-6-(5-phosphoribosylamino)uracil reductase|nr:bifunctional diaminohydroxyphosphoribosylaminopyrimidine deaminase/5-amino-6-(5-phosphoribosylamino)uracil reductase RibD [Saprospirales bacterium]MBK8921122.1 bifunctional diaminohydroxyphosphoribosylaminopyrimidine deaminase/5-amino-6-(5-phosphoribosylamino)uracil reductase RibD [Saprospirales bacterium]